MRGVFPHLILNVTQLCTAPSLLLTSHSASGLGSISYEFRGFGGINFEGTVSFTPNGQSNST